MLRFYVLERGFFPDNRPGVKNRKVCYFANITGYIFSLIVEHEREKIKLRRALFSEPVISRFVNEN